MGTQLNIKSDDAHELASKVSAITGESLTSAVTTALRERLERLQAADSIEARRARILAITADIRANLRHPLPTSDHGWLYDDEIGLPK
jgi:antitoxin VapB